MKTTCAVIALAMACAPSVSGQRMPPSLTQTVWRPQQPRPDSLAQDGEMVMAGVLGVVGGTYLGLVGGALLDRGLEGQCTGDDGCLGGAILGLYIGEPAAVAAGVHWANRARGAYGSEFAANLAILIVGSLAASRIGSRPGTCRDCGAYLLVLGVPIAQIAASIAIEKATSRKEP